MMTKRAHQTHLMMVVNFNLISRMRKNNVRRDIFGKNYASSSQIADFGMINDAIESDGAGFEPELGRGNRIITPVSFHEGRLAGKI